MSKDKAPKGAVNPPAVNSPGYDEHERLDTDVAGHEENFDPNAEDGMNVRAEADAQIAKNLADNAGEQPGTGGPEVGEPDTSPDAMAEEKPKRASRAKKSDTDK